MTIRMIWTLATISTVSLVLKLALLAALLFR